MLCPLLLKLWLGDGDGTSDDSDEQLSLGRGQEALWHNPYHDKIKGVHFPKGPRVWLQFLLSPPPNWGHPA